MNTSTWIILFLTLSVCTVFSQDANSSSAQYRNLVEGVRQIIDQRPGGDDPGTTVETGMRGLSKIAEFVELQRAAVGAWPLMVKDIQVIAPSKASKTILFMAFQGLPRDEYLKFVDQAVGLAESNVIDKQLLKWVLFPANKNVRGVIEYKYDKPIVKDILQRAEVLYAGDRNMVSYCQATLKGDTKKEAVAYLNDNTREAKPDVAVEEERANLSPLPAKSVTGTPPSLSEVSQRRGKGVVFWTVACLAMIAIIGGVVAFFIRRQAHSRSNGR